MLKRILLTAAFVAPLTAFALEIQPGNFYPDVLVTSPELAGINLLTREKVVQGYPNGTFGPSRLVNRAEFLKMAMLAAPDRDVPLVFEDCFPDVRGTDWFSQYVCAAKKMGVVKGNPDGLFHPERTVQYDEALKMLTLLFHYEIPNIQSSEWGEPYYRAAEMIGTDLPVSINFSTQLTRGMTARLVGAFMAERSGQLVEFRMAESGKYTTSSSSSSSSSSSAVSSSVSSSATSSSSSSSSSSLFTIPPVSHFLLIGKGSDAIASGIIRSNGEQGKVSIAQVKLFSEARSIEKLEIVTMDGQVLATLLRRVTTDTVDYKLTYEAQINPDQQVAIPADTDVRVALRAVIRSVDNAGFADDLVQVRTFNITLRGVNTNNTANIPLDGPFPKHQTAFGRIVAVNRLSAATEPLTSGTGKILTSFSVTGSTVAGRTLSLTETTFSVIRTGSVTLTNWKLTARKSGASVACSMNPSANTVSCPQLTDTVGLMDPREPLTLDLSADTVVTGAGIIEISLPTAGSPEALGSIYWTDHSGTYRWIEGPTPVMTGTKFQ